MTTAERIALIKAHTLNELAHKPDSVTAHDRMFLINEIERLNKFVDQLLGLKETNT